MIFPRFLLRPIPDLFLFSSCSYNGSCNRSYNSSISSLSRILVSTSHDVHRNLALEDWLFAHLDFSPPDGEMLFLWTNSPCVVFGRHQNPWAEADLAAAAARGVAVARRRSGGGSVYHDLGNLNATFFTTRKSYDRKGNLNLIVDALKTKWACLDIAVNARDDVVVDNGSRKVSGSSAKLSAAKAYHHCTLLVDVDLDSLGSLLKTPLTLKDNRATSSVPSPVRNLKAVEPGVEMEAVVETLADAFAGKLGRKIQAERVNPIERTFEGLDALEAELKSWDWIFGRTPKFVVEKRSNLDGVDVDVVVEVDRAKILDLSLSSSSSSSFAHDFLPQLENLLKVEIIGAEFRHQIIALHLAKLTNELRIRHPEFATFDEQICDLFDEISSLCQL